MFCRYCGNQLPDDARFCNSCGTPVAEPEPPKEKLPKKEAPKIVEMPKEAAPSSDWKTASQLDKELHRSSRFCMSNSSVSPKAMIYLAIGVAVFVVLCIVIGKIASASQPREATKEELDKFIEETTGRPSETTSTPSVPQTTEPDVSDEEPSDTYDFVYEDGYDPSIFEWDAFLDINQVRKECEDNPFNFAAAHEGERVCIYGDVRNLSTTYYGSYLVTLQGDSKDEWDMNLFGVYCYLRDDVMDSRQFLSGGYYAAIIGTIDKCSSTDVNMVDCVVYDAENEDYYEGNNFIE